MQTYDTDIENSSDSTSMSMLYEVESEEKKDEPEDQETLQIGSLWEALALAVVKYPQIHFFYLDTELYFIVLQYS